MAVRVGRALLAFVVCLAFMFLSFGGQVLGSRITGYLKPSPVVEMPRFVYWADPEGLAYSLTSDPDNTVVLRLQVLVQNPKDTPIFLERQIGILGLHSKATEARYENYLRLEKESTEPALSTVSPKDVAIVKCLARIERQEYEKIAGRTLFLTTDVFWTDPFASTKRSQAQIPATPIYLSNL